VARECDPGRLTWQLAGVWRSLAPTREINSLGKHVPFVAGWWLTYPSEKYGFVSWDDDSQYLESHKNHVPNHQPGR